MLDNVTAAVVESTGPHCAFVPPVMAAVTRFVPIDVDCAPKVTAPSTTKKIFFGCPPFTSNIWALAATVNAPAVRTIHTALSSPEPSKVSRPVNPIAPFVSYTPGYRVSPPSAPEAGMNENTGLSQN